MKTYILYNPLAGYGGSEEKARALGETLSGEVECRDVTAIADYAAFFAPLSEEDCVILCGGDGTLNRFANAIYDLSPVCQILYYAIGTGNDFLHDLGMQLGAAPFDIKPYIASLPTVEVGGRSCRFINGIGFGIDGYCCEVGDKKKQTAKKPVNYTAIAIKGMLFGYSPTNATVVVDGVTHTYKKVWMAAAMHGRFYGGGMMTAPEQDRLQHNGEVTLVLFHGKGRLKTLMAFPSIFEGKHIEHTDMVAVHKGRDITVTYDRPSPLQIDGETVLGVTEYRVTAAPIIEATVEAKKETV